MTTYIKFLPVDGYVDPLDQWFATRGSQFCMAPPKGTFGNAWKHFQLSGPGGGATFLWLVEARDAANHPTEHRKELSGTKCQ